MLIDWGAFDLIVFDVDGTLYSQRKLRLKMAGVLVRHCLMTGSMNTIRILGSYRQWREELAEQDHERFEEALVGRLASRYRRSEADIQAIVTEWMEVKPLKYLKECRYAGVKELVTRLRSTGKIIGVLSDYPAEAKLSRLELEADFVLCARDEQVAALKPNPRGLERLMALSGVGPAATVMIGDRAERDGEMGRRAGVKTYLRSKNAIPGWDCFSSFHDLLEPTPSVRASNPRKTI
jgi:HAD superfamily hydrolase (TIGR01549 family)